jgi:ATP-binding cassette, subfamily B, bacterial
MKKGQKMYARETLTIYRRHLLASPWLTLATVLLIMIAAALSMTWPLITQRIVDTLTSYASPSQEGFIETVKLVLLSFGTSLVMYAAWRLAAYCASELQPRVVKSLEEEALASLLQHSYRFFTDEFAGSLIRRIKAFSRSFVDLAESAMWRFIPLVIELTFLFVVFVRLHWLFFPIIFLWVLLTAYKSITQAKRKVALGLQEAAIDTRATGHISDLISNVLSVKLFAMAREEQMAFSAIAEERRIMRTASWRFGERMVLLQNVSTSLFILGMLTLLAWLWSKGLVGAGIFATALLYFNRLSRSLEDVGNALRRVFEALTESSEMTEIILRKPEITDRRGAKPLVLRQGKIKFSKISFNYLESRRVLDAFDLEIVPKEKIAIVGPSGAGKTTVVKLLLRLFDANAGKILIDGQDIASVTQESLHQNLALVPQDPQLFHRSLMDNIRFGRSNATDEEVIEASRKARCLEFIQGLPDGFRSMVGERGVKLSGGERQRVAIARAILKNAPILVLDEATSSLDSESEQLIQDALKELMKDKTVIVIAHRLSTIMQMDRIIVMQDGKIIEEGSHQDLLKKVGMYQKLWNIQAGGFAG